MGWLGAAPLTVVIAAGQDAEGSLELSEVSCCGKDCGSLEATWTDGRLSRTYTPRACDGGSGSCPYVYSWDGTAWVREAEMLVGALNRGAQRDDGLVLTRSAAGAEGPRVRIAT
ncbi:MAG: hypothetical protein HY906_06340 [Deltaproteobacteria bacterium]|nr:hypothetical protein [Deltaproteobacteria bacterium]